MKHKLGDLIELYSEACGIENLTVDEVSGINRDKEFFSPAKQVGTDTSKYKIVPPNYFACNLMHVGRDIVLPISLNTTNKNRIVSPAYTVFKIKDESKILSEFFFMWLKSDEKDRYFWLFTDSSVRDGLSWDDLCNIELSLPSLETQQKYVAVYQAMLANQRAYEKGLEDLKLVCDAYIEHLQHSEPLHRIGDFIQKEENNNKNEEYGIDDVKGISIQKKFIETKANMENVSLKPYLLVKPEHFAYVTVTSRNGEKITIAHNHSKDTYLVSSSYEVFSVKDENKLLPEYLALFFNRSEFDRYARFHSWGSAREVFSWMDLCEVKIPLPDLNVQQSIVDIYKVLLERRRINEQLKNQIKQLCPVLVRGAMAEI
ncbi:restriction endonuclease subunit S [Haemophilus parahaemolyticus]|uniref:restriction endonuclease subunit S n=1 Tax=Haemophilus parahaemolyticus TaxID=735 RepID=UPI0028EBF274|nr:restriction endonuclease subunit S [Haemophilus parahaemolyticus]